MKRLWIGVGLLAAMLLAGILTPEILDACHTPVVEDLNRAAELAMAEQWDWVENLTARAEENWQKKRPVTASLTDHEPMDDIDGLFSQLKVFAEAREPVAYASACVYLSGRLEALGDYHDWSLWNLF